MERQVGEARRKNPKSVHQTTAHEEVKKTKEVNIKPNKLQDGDIKTLVLNFLTAARAFRGALRELNNIKNYESNKQESKEILKELADIQNIIKLKILSLKKNKMYKTKPESSITCDTELSTESRTQFLLNLNSELSDDESSSSKCTRNHSVDSESEVSRISKSMSVSTQSLCSIKSCKSALEDEDVEEKFKQFLVNVNCPFCLKEEDNKNSLVKHLDRACVIWKSKKFIRSPHCPYSVFQILPNNTFKCNICPNSFQRNLKHYFVHLQSKNHILIYNKVASLKSYTELVFCSCCKIQIPNNATQLLLHLEHEAHRTRSGGQPSIREVQQKGVQCFYSRGKKFKCFSCPSEVAVHENVEEILGHFESQVHLKRLLLQKHLSKNLTSVYCMFCEEKVNVFNIMVHFKSSGHAQKEQEDAEMPFELCFLCGFKCDSKAGLAVHLELGCREFDEIRQKYKHQETEGFDRGLTQAGEDEKIPRKETTSEARRCIIVKDYPKLFELIKYFEKFGEIEEIRPDGENDVMIKFQKEEIVDDILEIEAYIEINGVKPTITRKEDLGCTDVKDGKEKKIMNTEDLDSSVVVLEESGKENSRKGESTNSCSVASNSGSYPGPGSSSVKSSTNSISSTAPKEFSEDAVNLGTLISLFDRVSTHLLNTVLKPDCKDFSNIAQDCENILNFGKCISTGFLKCGLLFPVEKMTLYCELSDDLVKSQCVQSIRFTESEVFNESLCKKCISLLEKSRKVSCVKLRENSFPLVEFYHCTTQKWCTISFRESDDILSDGLRCILEEKKELQSFALIIRFWLSVHKLEIKEFEFVIISLMVFFLINSGIVSSVRFRKNPRYSLLRNHVTLQGYFKMRTSNNYSVMEMFEKFLLFLNWFDFENMAICLPLEYPVPKSTLLKEPLKKLLCKWHDADSLLWIMDPFLYSNIASDVKKADFVSLLKTARETIEHYEIA